MAATIKKDNGVAAGELLPVEQLREQNRTDPAVFAGTSAMFGWRHGRELTPEEYEKAVVQFKRAAAGGRS